MANVVNSIQVQVIHLLRGFCIFAPLASCWRIWFALANGVWEEIKCATSEQKPNSLRSQNVDTVLFCNEVGSLMGLSTWNLRWRHGARMQLIRDAKINLCFLSHWDLAPQHNLAQADWNGPSMHISCNYNFDSLSSTFRLWGCKDEWDHFCSFLPQSPGGDGHMIT